MSFFSYSPVYLLVGVTVGHDDRDHLADALSLNRDKAGEALEQDLMTLAMLVVEQT